jgi:Family of unknown function (DUF6879)
VPEQPTFEDLFRTAERSAVHLEMRDGYMASDPAFVDWRAGSRFDPAERWRSWLGTVREITGRGVRVRRARIVSEPLSAYVRFEYDVTDGLNVAAGEQVRWLPRRKASDLALPGNDFWLFDDETVLFNHFTGDGEVPEQGDEEVTTDPAVVKLCSSAFEAVWERATPHAEYRPV